MAVSVGACGLEATIRDETDNVKNNDAEDKSGDLTLGLEKIHGSLRGWRSLTHSYSHGSGPVAILKNRELEGLAPSLPLFVSRGRA
jgi:hypothetical protein